MDITLGDIAWVGGSLLTLMIVSLLFAYRGEIAQAFHSFLVSRGSMPMFVASPQTSPSTLVRAQQDQVGLEMVRDFEAVLDYLTRHNLTGDQLIAVYAVSHREGDDYPLSANKIRDAVGGSRDDVLATIAQYRPKPAPARPSARLERPPNGWKAS